ncbi:hypothetical protein B0T19DRAFT_424796 [Cercophora scortea]|uniref:Pentatricopeptide repeat protein n=1 Tax=Cercophora scortea TaxID=314031 RepID=A0AAE0INW3_9PEZI|nr:hypothetical protein B0T19DRAFT_424796 [Cercophora scortea]
MSKTAIAAATAAALARASNLLERQKCCSYSQCPWESKSYGGNLTHTHTHTPIRRGLTPDPAPPPPSTLVERLAKVPVRRHGLHDSVVVKPVTQHPQDLQTRHSRHEHHVSIRQQELLEEKRLSKHAPAPDWRVILQNLSDWTPTRSPRHLHDAAVKVIIPPGSARLLFDDTDIDLGEIQSRTGCQILMHRGNTEWEDLEETNEDQSRGVTDPEQNTVLLLSGTRDALDAAVKDILAITRRLTVISTSNDTETVIHDGDSEPGASPKPRDHQVKALSTKHYPVSQSHMFNRRADDVPRPQEWTTATFSRYVATLTTSRMMPRLERRLYGDSDTHKHAVVRCLLAVFQEPAASSAISNSAFKHALAYMARHGVTFTTATRNLFDQVAALGFRMDTEVFNILAQSCVKDRDLRSFHRIIRLMVSRGYQPNFRTWLLFLQMIEAEEVRRYILHAMDTRNLLAVPDAARKVAQEMAGHDAYRAVQLGHDCKTFMDSQDALYGPNWLSTFAGSKIIDTFGRYGKMDAVMDVLAAMFASGEAAQPNVVTLNTVLTHCSRSYLVDLAIDFVRLFEHHGVTSRDPLTYHLLFQMACYARKPQVVSAIWRYAHLVNASSHGMRRRAAQILGGEVAFTRLTGRLKVAAADDEEAALKLKMTLVKNLLLGDFELAMEQEAAKQTASNMPRAKDTPAKKNPSHAIEEVQVPMSILPDAIAIRTQAGKNNTATDADPDPTEVLLNIARATESKDARFKAMEAMLDWYDRISLDLEPALPLGHLMKEAIAHDRKVHSGLRDGTMPSLPLGCLPLPTRLMKRRNFSDEILDR